MLKKEKTNQNLYNSPNNDNKAEKLNQKDEPSNNIQNNLLVKKYKFENNTNKVKEEKANSPIQVITPLNNINLKIITNNLLLSFKNKKLNNTSNAQLNGERNKCIFNN